MQKRDWRDHWIFDALIVLMGGIGLAADWQRGFHIWTVILGVVLAALLAFGAYRVVQKRIRTTEKSKLGQKARN
jgi:hypothetical protein